MTGTAEPGAPLPEGMRVALDGGLRRIEGGTVLVGGSPLRLVRVTGAGARLVERLASGAPVPTTGGGARLVRRLLATGMAHPRPASAVGAPTADDVAVVIPVRGTAAEVAPTLAALGPVGEVVVVDDGSPVPITLAATTTAEHGSSVAAGPTVLRHDVSRGPGSARETGWRATAPPIVAFVDAEVVPEAGWLDGLLAHLADPDVVAVAPRIRPPAPPTDGGARRLVEEASVPGGGRSRLRRWIAAYEAERSPLDMGPAEANVRPGRAVPYVPTTALVVRRSALEQVGGFDPALRFGEDVDLVWRLVAAGGTVRYDPAVLATHPVRPDARAWVRQRVDYGSSAAPLALRHGAAVAPVRLSGWSAAAWGLAAVGHPVVGAAVAAGSTVALARTLDALADPVAEALRLAGRGHLLAGAQVARAVRRTWLPLALGVAVVSRRARRTVAAAVLGPAVVEAVRTRSLVGPVVALVDDAAYCAGVWRGSWRARSARALLPAGSGPLDPPA